MINSTALVCPTTVYDSEKGAPRRGRRELLISSESLGESLTTGSPSTVSVELVEVPFVATQSRTSTIASIPHVKSILLTMSGLVLEREIRIGSTGGPYHRCEKRSSFEIGCQLLLELSSQASSSVSIGSLQLWPGGPFLPASVETLLPVQTRILKLQPHVLVAGVPG